MLTKAIGLTKIDTSLSRDQIIQALRRLAEEWQETAAEDDNSLLDIEGSVGLLLYDVVIALGLTYQEQEQVLGSDLQSIKLAVGDPIFTA